MWACGVLCFLCGCFHVACMNNAISSRVFLSLSSQNSFGSCPLKYEMLIHLARRLQTAHLTDKLMIITYVFYDISTRMKRGSTHKLANEQK